MHGDEDEQQHTRREEDPEKERPALQERHERIEHLFRRVDVRKLHAERDRDGREHRDRGSDRHRCDQQRLAQAEENHGPVRNRVVEAAEKSVDDSALHHFFGR